MEQLKVITVTHKRVSLEQVGKFHLDDSIVHARLTEVKEQSGLDEMMYLSTCNRVEFFVVCNSEIDNDWLVNFYGNFKPEWTTDEVEDAVLVSEIYEGRNVVEHLFNVASSIDSMVIGEREIITQVRTAFEQSKKMGLTGDIIRLLLRKTIETAKEIYTHTEIASKPVSVVSLAFRQLQKQQIPAESRILFVGAGQTNTTMARFLKKRGYKNCHVFNRSLENGKKLAKELGCEASTLDALLAYDKGFDILITCTGSAEPVLSPAIYKHLLQGESQKKTVIDVAIPSDLDPLVLQYHRIKYIGVEELKTIAEANLRSRGKEVQVCRAIINKNLRDFFEIFKARQVELAMRAVPTKVKEIREMAMNTVFAKELAGMDDDSKEVLEKVVAYMEKKYISGPMKMAKEIMLGENSGQTKIKD